MNTRREPAQLALDLLRRSRLKVATAAVLADRQGRPFAWGWNHGWVHAEEHALSRANPRRVPGSTLIVVAARDGRPLMSRPCERPKGCLALARSRGVGTIVYRNRDRAWTEETL